MIRLAIIALCALIVGGCAPEYAVFPASIYISSDFSQEEQQEILEATDHWNVATGGAVRFYLGSPVNADVEVIKNRLPGTHLGIVHKFWPIPGAPQMARWEITLDTINIERGGYNLVGAAIHEIGHLVVGPDHPPEDSDYPRDGILGIHSRISCIDQTSVDYACDVRMFCRTRVSTCWE